MANKIHSTQPFHSSSAAREQTTRRGIKPSRPRPSPVRSLLRLILPPLMTMLLTSPGWSEVPQLTVGYVPNADFVPLFLAKENGYFEKAGLGVALASVVNQHNVPAALTSGSIELGPMAVPTFLLAAQNGVDLVAVAGYTRNLASMPEASLMVREGLPFTGPASLEGKRVGIPGLKSAFDVHFRMWLLNNKVPLERVSLVEVNFPQMSGMLKTGEIDAAIAVEPFESEIARSGSGSIAAPFMAEVSKDDAGLIWVATIEWAEAHAKERALFLAALKQGVAGALHDASGAQDVEKHYLKFASTLSDDYNFSLTAADLKLYEDMMVKVGFLPKGTDVSNLIVR